MSCSVQTTAISFDCSVLSVSVCRVAHDSGSWREPVIRAAPQLDENTLATRGVSGPRCASELPCRSSGRVGIQGSQAGVLLDQWEESVAMRVRRRCVGAPDCARSNWLNSGSSWLARCWLRMCQSRDSIESRYGATIGNAMIRISARDVRDFASRHAMDSSHI